MSTPNRRFELKRELGSGSFGTVYLADMVSTGGFRRSVALKLLNAEWDGASDAGRRLRDEARLLGRLRHRNIVAVDDLIQIDGRWAVVMEHIPGADLERVLMALQRAGEKVPLHVTLEVMAATCAALDAARNSRTDDGQPLDVVHRDIKPSNIRITEAGDIKVLDFGIARASFEGREARTERVRYGSVGYMAPERLLGEPETTAGDVFAVAVVAVEMLTVRPFGRIELAPDKAELQVDQRLRELRSARPDLSDELVALLRGMLAYAPADRPEPQAVGDVCRRLLKVADDAELTVWARDVLPRLDGILGDASASVERILTEDLQPIGTSLRPAPANPTMVVTPELPDTAPVPTPRAAPSIWALVALALAIGLGGVAYIAQSRVEPPRSGAVLTPQAPPKPRVEVSAPEAPAPVLPTEAPPAEAPLPEAKAEPAPPPRTARPAAPAEPTPPPAPEAAPARTLRGVKFVVEGASAVSARCGGVNGSGTTSAYLRDIPAGACTLTATVGDATASTTLNVDEPGGKTCTLAGGALSCR